ncbi:MAG: DNA-binding response regulator [Blastocatellia bacterium AA13]|nr:MAG: DNA-binding response regulator [Blastocatellia bacterium AA13]
MNRLRAYLVDDESLALRRLARLLNATRRVEIVGSTTNPLTAAEFLSSNEVDVVFLDIHMPRMNGFEVLARLVNQPRVVFTTAYDQYALKAFDVNCIDYLLKPIDPAHLERALKKIESTGGGEAAPGLEPRLLSILEELSQRASNTGSKSLDRICTRVGEKILLIDVAKISHFYARDRITYAATDNKTFIVDFTIAALEESLREKDFVRIHRAVLLNLTFVDELHRWFGGRLIARLKDKNRTELTVARNYARLLRQSLGLK